MNIRGKKYEPFYSKRGRLYHPKMRKAKNNPVDDEKYALQKLEEMFLIRWLVKKQSQCRR